MAVAFLCGKREVGAVDIVLEVDEGLALDA